jgi:hypothetical protein
MLGWLAWLRKSTTNKEDRINVSDKPFTTQDEMLRNQGGQTSGMCSQLSNAYLDARLKGIEPEFLKSEQETYQKGLEEAMFQSKLLETEQQDIRHSAFVRNNTPHKDVTLKSEEMRDPAKLQNTLSQSRFALFSIPTSRQNRSHMIAFERGNNGECRMFDAALPGGEYKSACEIIYPMMSQLLELYCPNDNALNIEAGLA